MEETGKLLLVLAVILAVVGLALLFGGKIPFLGKLPGDLFFKKGNFSFYFPLATSILLSVVLTLLLWLVQWFRK